MGRVILVGRGSANITNKIAGGVHVRLIGSFKRRKEYTKAYFKCNDTEAEGIIHNEDKGRGEYLKQNFGQDIDDPLFYDLVINTDLVSYDQAVLLIGSLVVMKIESLRNG
jgi:cytidylate kinase